MTEQDKRYDMLDETDRDEAIRIRKIKQGLIENTENEEYVKEKEERDSKQYTFKEKLSNFWYHYKWMVLIFGFIAIGAVVFTIQAFNAESYDTTVLFCTYDYYDQGTLDTLKTDLKKYVPDIDGDEEINVGLFQAAYQQDEKEDLTGYRISLQSRIMAEIVSGENNIFIVEKGLMDDLVNKGVFADLNKTLKLNSKEPVYGICIKDSKLLEGKIFENKRDDYYIAIRVHNDKFDKEKYNAQLEAVKKICKEVIK